MAFLPPPLTVRIYCDKNRYYPSGKRRNELVFAQRVADSWFCTCCRKKVRVVWG